jgi:hypothetical protein
MTRNKHLIPIIALMLVMGAMLFSVPAYAADDPGKHGRRRGGRTPTV